MNKTLIGSLAAISLASTGVFAFTGSAEAAALTGEFQLDGGDDTSTTITLFSNKFTFAPNPGTIDIKFATDSFTAFTTASIRGPQEINPGSNFTNPFLDLGTDADTANDGLNIFTITEAYGYSFSRKIGSLWEGSVAFTGFFTSDDNNQSNGDGLLTFQFNANNITNQAQALNWIDNKLTSNTGLTGVQFSGVAIATAPQAVPEPATLMGLGVVGAALATSRRQKAVKS